MITRAPVLYVAVSGICLLLHNATMIIAVGAGCPLAIAVLASFCIVAASGYVLHSRLSFHQPLALSRFARYALAMSANIPLAFVLTWFWRTPMGQPIEIASPAATLCMLAANFMLSRWAIGGPRRGVTPS